MRSANSGACRRGWPFGTVQEGSATEDNTEEVGVQECQWLEKAQAEKYLAILLEAANSGWCLGIPFQGSA